MVVFPCRSSETPAFEFEKRKGKGHDYNMLYPLKQTSASGCTYTYCNYSYNPRLSGEIR